MFATRKQVCTTSHVYSTLHYGFVIVHAGTLQGYTGPDLVLKYHRSNLWANLHSTGHIKSR